LLILINFVPKVGIFKLTSDNLNYTQLLSIDARIDKKISIRVEINNSAGLKEELFLIHHDSSSFEKILTYEIDLSMIKTLDSIAAPILETIKEKHIDLNKYGLLKFKYSIISEPTDLESVRIMETYEYQDIELLSKTGKSKIDFFYIRGRVDRAIEYIYCDGNGYFLEKKINYIYSEREKKFVVENITDCKQ